MGIQITADAFSAVLGDWVYLPIAISLCCFAFATIIGWGLYGMRCAQFLLGDRAWKYFVIIQGISVVLGSVIGTGIVWSLSETANGLMAIPNLLILISLTPELVRLVKEYKSFYGRSSANGGTHEDIKKPESLRFITNA